MGGYSQEILTLFLFSALYTCFMRILIVEDEKKLAVSLKKLLKSDSYAVDVIFDGMQGYETAVSEDYDVMILDLGLPSLGGITIAKKLREEGVKTPILMLTARDSQKDKISGLDSGADDYLVKPFDYEELLARIRALLRRGDVNGGTELHIGSLVLNPHSHIVTRNGITLNLSAKEYALLEYLMRNSGKILSKTQILDHVWDIDTDPFSNVVDVYIGYLRTKIDKVFPEEESLLQTVKGIGYKIGR